jgi:hypothetical protein
MRHLKAYVDYLPKVEEGARNAGTRFDASPVYAARGQALARVQAELDGRWMPFIRREMAKAKGLQARHRQFRRIRASQQSLPG